MPIGIIARIIGCVLFACVYSAAATLDSPQQPKLPAKIKDPTIAQFNLKRYQQLLRAYCAGDPSSIDALLSWEAEPLLDAVTVINGPLDDTRPWPIAEVKAAALMHTDAVLRLVREPGDEDLLTLQLDAAGRVLVRGAPYVENPDLELAKRNGEVRAFASRWYVTVSRLLRDRARFNAAHVLLGLGRDRLPGDAAVLYESGTMEEYVASHPSEKLPEDFGSHIGGHVGETIVDRLQIRHGQQLAAAERWLRQALVITPARPEVRLHLGRVLMLRGRDEEAIRLLEAIPAAPSGTGYLAAMFLGALEERRGAIDLAIDAYRRAENLLPGAQSATVALSRLLQQQGRGDESRSRLESFFALVSSPLDPWWTYFFDQTPEVFARVHALFSEAAR